MPITGTTTDYTGRTIDMYVSGSLDPLSPNSQAVTYAFGSSAKYIAGVQKLAQRYLIMLMNSGFPAQVLGMNNSNIQVAVRLFNLASFDIVKTFKDYQKSNPGAPLDEQIVAVQLLGTTLTNKTQLTFSLQLVTAAGTNIPFVLPLPLS